MLQCGRITIHKNLVASFIMRSVLFVIYFEPFVTKRQHSYRDIVRTLLLVAVHATLNNSKYCNKHNLRPIIIIIMRVLGVR